MKILQINKFFFIKGGAEKCLFNLSDLLAKKGHYISVWSTKHKNNFPYHPNENNFAQFIDFSKKENIFKEFKKFKRLFWNKEANQKLEKVIKSFKPEVIHLHNIFSHFSPSIISLIKKYNIPIVMTLHDYKLFCPNYKFLNKNKICFDCLDNNNYRSCFLKKCIKNSYLKSFAGYLEGKWHKDFLKTAHKIDAFIAPSLYIKRKAIKWGINREKIFHLPNFIEENKNIIPKREEKNYILYYGRLSSEKGINLLIKSFLEISKEFPHWKLKLIGDGPEKNRLIKTANNSEIIEFPGYKKGIELKKIIAGADLIVLPSLWPENNPYSILESMILSRPIIASRIGGIPELIKDKKTGILFKPGSKVDLKNKLIYSINHLKEMKEMSQSAQKEVIKKYNSENYYRKIIKIYEGIKNN